jgi:hypothetical protein
MISVSLSWHVVFENYVELLDVDGDAVELSLWDTAGEWITFIPFDVQDKKNSIDYAHYPTRIRMSCFSASR